jgi:hypothetical protein
VVLRGLGRLGRAGFPVEGCAHAEAVSELAGRGVLVTGFVPGPGVDGSGCTFAFLGALLAVLLGGLHARPVEGRRPGGGWYHLVVCGTPSGGIGAVLTLVGAHGGCDGLSEVVCELGGCADLRHAFVCPGFVPADVIAGPGGRLAVVGWRKAGRGPWLWSLGFLLFAVGARSPELVDVVVSRYRRHAELGPGELTRLSGMVRARPLLIGCWPVAMGRKPAGEVAAGLEDLIRLSQRIAAIARHVFVFPPQSP